MCNLNYHNMKYIFKHPLAKVDPYYQSDNHLNSTCTCIF